ncbi:MAG: hypothetical protein JW969_04330 [Spirochaetales bacterium]|nr:hypothetical protein [Spirochaetales bacterium]
MARADFERLLVGKEGVELEEYAMEENGNSYSITAGLRFKTVHDLAEIHGLGEKDLFFIKNGSHHFFHEEIRLPDMDLTPEDKAIWNEILIDEYFSFSITVPSAIYEKSMGTLQPDKRTLFYSISVKDLIINGKNLVFDVKW